MPGGPDRTSARVRRLLRSEVAAGLVTAAGAQAVVIGSTALHLQGEHLAVHDLDLVPDPRALPAVWAAIASLGVIDARSWPPPSGSARMADVVTAVTSFGPVDVLVRRGDEEYATLQARSTSIDVGGVAVRCASVADAWRLRRLFKEAGGG